MSGVAAVLPGAGAADASGARDLCAAMLQAMPHRGPAQTVAGAAIGARNETPRCFASAEGVHVGMDGDIHNRAELDVDADADAASVVLACYQRWGVDAVDRLVGDFAFVLHDEARQQLVAARDALGMRPLYYHRDERALRVASEAHALVASGIDGAPDPLGIALFIALAYDEESCTLRKHVNAIPPAHVLVASPDGVTLRRYWTPDPWRKLDVDDEEASRMFADVFGEAVRCRIPASGKVGVMLSGGLDSCSIASQASALGAVPTALHCSLDGWDCDETHISAAVSSRWGMPRIEVTGDDLAEAARPQMRHPDHLYNAWGACFDVMFPRARSAGLGTVMTGLGGDQMVDENGGECVDALKDGNLREVGAITGIDRDPLSLDGYARLWASGIKRLVPARLRLATRKLRRRGLPPYLSETWGRRALEVADGRRVRALEERWPDESSAAMYALLSAYGVRVGAPQTSLSGALSGVEVAHPFLDRRVFELALALPRRHRLRRGWHKRKPVLRRAMRDLLPPEVSARRDAAEFSCYFRDIYLGHHRRVIADLFSDSRLAELGIIDIRAVRSALDAGLPGASSIIRFGLLLSMELWLRQDAS